VSRYILYVCSESSPFIIAYYSILGEKHGERALAGEEGDRHRGRIRMGKRHIKRDREVRWEKTESNK
jgi:hypothetical protein